jgi:lysophospholipase L1-like esterase
MRITPRARLGARVFAVLSALLALSAGASAQQPTPNVRAGEDLARRLAAAEKRLADWAGLARYRQANAELGPPLPGERRVVFYGNSITDSWAQFLPAHFPGKPYIGRGISGQTTPQMLVRFRQDVIALDPAAVVILAGTNDIAGNTGPATLDMIEDNLRSMVELAQANGILVVLCSVLPAVDYPWRPGVEPAAKIVALNTWIKAYAAERGAVFVDYWSAMADARQGLRSDLTTDGVHPNEAGYRLMASLVEPAIEGALLGSAPTPTSSKPRVVVTTDPELDDSNSLVRYLLYSTDFRTEGIIYASSQFHWKRGWHRKEVVRPRP